MMKTFFKSLLAKNSSNVSQEKKIVYSDDNGNRIEIVNPRQDFLHEGGVNIRFLSGKHSKVLIDGSCTFANCLIEIGSNSCSVEIGANCSISNTYVRMCYGKEQCLIIGKGTTIHGADFFLDENGGCIIGDDCMLSDSIKVWGSDGHSILSQTTGEVLNSVKHPVIIGNHVWIGQAVRLTKNAQVPAYSVVGMASLVTKEFKEPNSLIAGVPAKIIKKDINWHRLSPMFYEPTH